MKSKILSRRTLLITVFVGATLFLMLFLNIIIPQGLNLPADRQVQNGSALLTGDAIAVPEQEQVSPGLPMRLKIPKINVDAVVEYVGLTPQGAVGVPKGPSNTAWFDLGPRPGEKGSSVIVGHFGWKNGIPAAFDNLNKLRKGDKLYVEDDKGAIISFVVRESRRYDQKADASDVFSSNDGKPHLNLITCEGIWSKVSKSYSNRLVVFTDKE